MKSGPCPSPTSRIGVAERDLACWPTLARLQRKAFFLYRTQGSATLHPGLSSAARSALIPETRNPLGCIQGKSWLSGASVCAISFDLNLSPPKEL
jgi:hypothetical protein